MTATPTPTSTPISAQDLINHLKAEIAWLDTKWKLFDGLYGRAASQIDEMDRRTGFPFGVFQDSLLDDVLLSIARLFDAAMYPTYPRNGKEIRYNLTFLAVKQLSLNITATEHTTLWNRIEATKKRLDPLVMHRNRRIGHLDVAVARKIEPLPAISREEIGNAVADVKQLLIDISVAFDRSGLSFLSTGDEDREVDILIRILKLGNDAIDAEREARRKRAKELTGDDEEIQDDPLNEWY